MVLGQITKLGSNLISVQPGKSNEKGPPAQLYGIVVTTLTTDDAQAIRDTTRVPHAVAINSAVRGQATIVWQNQSIDTNFIGTEYTYPNVVSITMKEGRFFDEKEDKGNAYVVVLGSSVADDLFGESGTDPIGQVIKAKSTSAADVGGVPLRVIGVVSPRGSAVFQNQDDQIFLPLVIGQKQLLGIHYLQMINIKVDNADNVESTRQDVKSFLTERHHIKREVDEDFTVRNIADAISILTTITNALRLFLTAMAAIALIVGGVGILNIMLVTVAERTREIGLRKAVGASNAKVRNQFLFESGVLTFLGGVVGIIVGITVSYMAALVMRGLGYDWAFVISLTSIFMAAGVSILTGVVFGLYPAYKASKLNPIDALRYE
jgi:putative ABC transport system permease protein